MIRLYLYWIRLALIVLLFESYGCGDDKEGADALIDDASIVDAPGDVKKPDVTTDIDARRPDTICPSVPPTIGTSCLGDLFCSYAPSEDCHWDCFANCGSCIASRPSYPAPCDNERYRCENGTWKRAGGPVEGPCTPYTCDCSSNGGSGGSNGKVDSSTDDDAGSDDDAGN